MSASTIPDIRDEQEHVGELRTAQARAISVSLLLLVAGCAVPTTGIVPRGDELLTVTRQGSGFWVSTDSLKVEALKEADAFCRKHGKTMKFIHSKEIPAGPFGRWPESEVLFRCE